MSGCNKFGAIWLILLLANPACCCFGKWLAQLTLDQPAPAACCADSESDEDSSAPQGDQDCVCKTTQVTQAKPETEQVFPLASPLVARLPVEILSVPVFAAQSVDTALFLDDTPPTTVPARLAYQAFLL